MTTSKDLSELQLKTSLHTWPSCSPTILDRVVRPGYLGHYSIVQTSIVEDRRCVWSSNLPCITTP